ncbi:LysR family transcriptional regulator [Pacificibacter marinus]|uniref:HTH-type transcriptional regulator GbpR n=1 Tax=Pacificibacter marinus TaxID=658057 RepID=A0A1Y5RT68_9RHOB|nr:LysR family transcriptional regulator [Pacificibacter marinus]SEK43380.1 DNA-binding transcriptional regulator, LysR family [Pacificibacter marinus]SLN23661.1 HTH-type transcriptional regulator GbpR [Pacificibacter marinus]
MERLLQKGLKISHLRLADALAREGQLSSAALKMGIAQPAASRLASEAERIIGAPLYSRAGRGIELTPEGLALARRATRILREIQDADREIDELKSGLSGRVCIGSVTGPAIEHVLPALRQARIALPNVQIEIEVGTSDTLGPMLLDGQIDFSLARLPTGQDASAFHMTVFGKEPLSLVARKNHPVFRHENYAKNIPVPIEDLLNYDWVMPNTGAILRNTVTQALARKGHPSPERILSTSSFLLVLATISQTNAIAPIATSVAQSFTVGHDSNEQDTGALVQIIDTDVVFEIEDYGLMTRAGSTLTPAAQSVLQLLRNGIGLSES